MSKMMKCAEVGRERERDAAYRLVASAVTGVDGQATPRLL